jgi:galactonate dehydratase
MRVYANGWGGGGSIQQLQDDATAVIAKGFSALKFDPFPNPWRAYIGKAEEDHAVRRVAAVREAVGPDVEILVEVHRRLAPAQAIRVANRIEEFRPYWYEEPVSARDLDGLAEVKHTIGLPVVTGEELYTKNEFRDVMEKRAADLLNPDVCNCGGILELREIAAMAECHHIAVSPHNYNSTTIGLAATVHATAGMVNCPITEYFVNFEEIGREIAHTPLVAQDGYVELPTRPGLGVDLDEEKLKSMPYREFPMRNLRRPADEG